MRLRVGLAAALALAVLGGAAAPVWAAADLVGNPSGAVGTTGWGVGRPKLDLLQPIVANGVDWLHWLAPSPLYDWADYRLPSSLPVGAEVSCGLEAMGSGTVFAALYTGVAVSNPDYLVRGAPVSLGAVPRELTVSALLPGGRIAPPELEVRTAHGPVSVDINRVTCLLGPLTALVPPVAAVRPIPRRILRQQALQGRRALPLPRATSRTLAAVEALLLRAAAAKAPAHGLRAAALRRQLLALEAAFPRLPPLKIPPLKVYGLSPGGVPILVPQDGQGTVASPIRVTALWALARQGQVPAVLELLALGLTPVGWQTVLGAAQG